MKARDVFEVNIQRAESILKLHRSAYPTGRPAPTGDHVELLRATIVFAVSALDAYIHKKVLERVNTTVQLHKRLPYKCTSLVTRNFKEASVGSELINIAIRTDSERQIMKLLEAQLKKLTYQKAEQISDAFEMMEAGKDIWRKIDRRMSRRRAGRLADTKKFLNDLATRRDRMVHECDMFFAGSSYSGRLLPIGRTYVHDSLKRLRKFVTVVEAITP